MTEKSVALGVLVLFLLSIGTGAPSLWTWAVAAGLAFGVWRVFVGRPAQRAAGDRAAAVDLRAGLDAPLRPLDETSSGYTVVSDLRLGEIVRQFDQQTHGAISGWLDHRLRLGGWGVGATVGRVGLGTGSMGLTGTSGVHLGLEATTRASLMGDGWIAVLDVPTPDGAPDVIRLVVPSEPAALGLARALGTSLSGAYRAALPECARVIDAYSDQVSAPGRTDISYAGDRLAAILRLPAEQRPAISVVGMPLGNHAILGGALRIGTEDHVQQLVPFAVIDRLLSVPVPTTSS